MLANKDSISALNVSDSEISRRKLFSRLNNFNVEKIITKEELSYDASSYISCWVSAILEDGFLSTYIMFCAKLSSEPDSRIKEEYVRKLEALLRNKEGVVYENALHLGVPKKAAYRFSMCVKPMFTLFGEALTRTVGQPGVHSVSLERQLHEQLVQFLLCTSDVVSSTWYNKKVKSLTSNNTMLHLLLFSLLCALTVVYLSR